MLVDLDNYPAQKPQIHPIMMRGMKFGTEHGLKKEARIIGKALTRMQMRRLVKEAGMSQNSTFQTEQEAREWLLHGSE